MFKAIATLVLVAGFAAPAGAATTLLDFDAARGKNGNTGYVYGALAEDGYSVSANRCATDNTCFVTTGTTLSSLDRTGAALTNYLGNAMTTVARTDGNSFFLDSLMLANNYGNFSGFNSNTFNIGFAFNFSDGTKSTTTYVLDNLAGQRLTVNLLEFDLGALSSFSFTPGAGTSGFVQFDNIQLHDVAAAVPEPATWAMMLIGFGGIGFAMRRKAKVRTTVSYA